MSISQFDQFFFELTCQGGHKEEIVLSRLDNRDSWRCEVCGRVTDLRAEPHRTAINDLREMATELDNRILNRRSKLSVHCRSSSTSAAEALYKLSSGCRLQ
jgi:hypothetical protein